MYKIRKASIKDAELYYDWVNDDQVRCNSVNSSEILMNDHLKWFNSKLKSSLSYLFVLEFKNKPLGQIRFDKIEGGAYWIDYSIDKNYRGKKIGIILVEKGIRELKKYDAECIIYALVKDKNISSCKIFEKLNFQKVESRVIDDYNYFVFGLNNMR